jgi:hypothetical protein
MQPSHRSTEMDDTIDAVQADRDLKNKHRAMWALGDYPALATDIIAGLGPALVRASRVRPGDWTVPDLVDSRLIQISDWLPTMKGQQWDRRDVASQPSIKSRQYN